jgi:hypothetical protein
MLPCDCNSVCGCSLVSSLALKPCVVFAYASIPDNSRSIVSLHQALHLGIPPGYACAQEPVTMTLCMPLVVYSVRVCARAGAGVAALLGLHYRARYASVRCWCFAPPGGLMSPAAASSLKDICYSLVSAKVRL